MIIVEFFGQNEMTGYGDYLIIMDESGDHSFLKVDADFPIFGLKPDQPNQAFDIIQPKLMVNGRGRYEGIGLKVFP